jgi:hypothetical protein
VIKHPDAKTSNDKIAKRCSIDKLVEDIVGENE